MNNSEFLKIKLFLKSENPKVLVEKFFTDVKDPVHPYQKKVLLEDQGFRFLAIYDARNGELINFLETHRPGEKRDQ